MTYSCNHIQTVMIDHLLGQLPQEQAPALSAHLDKCPVCRRFGDFLADQDRMLSDWGRHMQNLLAQKAEKTAAAFLARTDVRPKQAPGPVLYYAAAAVLMVGVLIGLIWLLNQRPDQSKIQIAGPGAEPPAEVQSPQEIGQLTLEQKKDKAIQQELLLAEMLFEKGDIMSLAALYEAGGDQTRQAVLNYLAQIGTDRALQVLSDLKKSALQPTDPNGCSKADPADRDEEDHAEAAAAKADAAAGLAPIQAPRMDYFDPNAVDADNWQSGILGIRVLDDETGKPIPGANLKFQIVPEAAIPKTAVTNQFGRYELKYYNSQTRILSISVHREPYAGKRLIWHVQETGQAIPLQYQVRLRKGVVVGGLVETVEGHPLAGVKVTIFMTGLDHNVVESFLIGDPNLATGKDGRWELSHFPDDLKETIYMKVEHPEYVSTEPGGIPTSLESLLNKTCVIRMRRGLSVRGTVADTEGRPIEGALVCLGTFWEVADNKKIQTDKQGRFELTKCEPSDSLLTVTARGYAPDMREIRVSKTLPEVNFQLTAGYTITVHAVDQKGYGIGGVMIQAGTWRTYGFAGLQEARTLPCSAVTDASGYAVLPDLPADTVKYYILKEGYADYHEYLMTAGQQDRYQIVLLPRGKLAGRVLDAETGLPVNTFYMIEGVVSGNTQKLAWESFRRKLFTNGVYERPLNVQDSWLAVRIEAEGYLPAESRVYVNEGKEVAEDIFLYKGQGPGGMAVLPNGQPASGAEVCVQEKNQFVQIENGKIQRRGFRIVSGQTDGEGRFRLPPPAEAPLRLIVLNEAGGAIIPNEEFERTGVILLQPWSAVEGTVYLNNKPAPNQTLVLTSDLHRDMCMPILIRSKAATDENGKFFCGRLFPGRIQVSRTISLDHESSLGVEDTFVSVEPGQTAFVKIERSGRTVIGRLLLSEEMKAGFSLPGLTAALNIRRQSESEDMKNTDPPRMDVPENYFVMTKEQKEQAMSEQTEALMEGMKKRQETAGFSQSVPVDSDGALRAENIPAGTYVLSGSIYDLIINRYSNVIYPNNLGSVNFTFTVPEGTEEADDEKPLDLGTIPVERVKPKKALQVGHPAPEFSLRDSKGNAIRLDEFRGKYLLLDAGMCMSSKEPQEAVEILKSVYTRFHSAGQLEILSGFYGSGSDESVAKAMVYFRESQEIPWPLGMIFLDGSQPEEWRNLILTGGYPSLLLLDPEGNIAALNIRPEELKETLARHLPPVQDKPKTP